eukprot:3375563-Rhodomonas_salina.1
MGALAMLLPILRLYNAILPIAIPRQGRVPGAISQKLSGTNQQGRSGNGGYLKPKSIAPLTQPPQWYRIRHATIQDRGG